MVHRYGPHIFHTNSDDVFAYLSRFTAWRGYEHRVLGARRRQAGADPDQPHHAQHALRAGPCRRGGGGGVPGRARRAARDPHVRGCRCQRGGPRTLRNLLSRLYPQAMGARSVRTRQGGDGARADPDEYRRPLFPRSSSGDAGRRAIPPCSSACWITRTSRCRPASISPIATCRPGTPSSPGRSTNIFGHRFGALPYRSLEFRHETHDVAQFQPVAVVNYPDPETPFTRITEYKHLTGQSAARTSISYEFPRAEGDPYYPIPRAENQALFRRYEALADALPDVSFVGRLATYRYYNMDQVVRSGARHLSPACAPAGAGIRRRMNARPRLFLVTEEPRPLRRGRTYADARRRAGDGFRDRRRCHARPSGLPGAGAAAWPAGQGDRPGRSPRHGTLAGARAAGSAAHPCRYRLGRPCLRARRAGGARARGADGASSLSAHRSDPARRAPAGAGRGGSVDRGVGCGGAKPPRCRFRRSSGDDRKRHRAACIRPPARGCAARDSAGRGGRCC